MTVQAIPTSSKTAVNGHRLHSYGPKALRLARPRMSSGAMGTLGSVRRFMTLAVHPVPGWNGFPSGVLTALVAGGACVALTLLAVPGTMHEHVHTRFGDHAVTVAVSRWPQAIAIACLFAAALFVVAGVRLQARRDEQRATQLRVGV